jgi:phenylalanyl-tRNA synthetase beta chain
MLVSWNWLKEYVTLDMPHDELVERLSMSGLNHEGTSRVGDDPVIDLEVTSNRPDCLGHIGVAREIAVLWDRQLTIPDPAPQAAGPAVTDLTKVGIQCPDLCYRYHARVLRGVQVGPSPDWLVQRLAAIGIATVNNVVDITNYVSMECGQPLHAFDLAALSGPEIIVREALPGEQFEAINHKVYDLEPGMCVIADAQRSVALGGVMGGVDTEVTESTTDLLIEAADFAALCIRTTARKLNLHSPSSYRFERGVDPKGLDWASRRCCQLILELAGGQLAEGVIAEGQGTPERSSITLRLAQVPRVLGIDVPADRVRDILTALGCKPIHSTGDSMTIVPPSWRRDLVREVDLLEEVARVYGYDRIPEDVGVPMCPSHRTDHDRVQDKVRHALTAAGFDEAITPSVVPADAANLFSPWTDADPIQASTPMLKGADRLRRSLAPSLLEARRINESLANPVIELFETAQVYLPRQDKLPEEKWTLAVTSGGDFFRLKGVLETIVAAVNPALRLEASDTRYDLLDQHRSCELRLDGRLLGFMGEVSEESRKTLGLRSTTTIAELDLTVLADSAQLIPQHCDQSPYPAIDRDMNLIVDESVQWSALSNTVRQTVGDCLETIQYLDTYRDPKKDGAGKKRLLLSITLRSHERTLTNEQADRVRDDVVQACQDQFGAVLLGG